MLRANLFETTGLLHGPRYKCLRLFRVTSSGIPVVRSMFGQFLTSREVKLNAVTEIQKRTWVDKWKLSLTSNE